MQAAVIVVITTLTLGLIPYGLPVIMPSWRWLLACTIVVGGPLAALWIQDYVARQSPDFTEGPGGGLGFALVLFFTIAFSTGLLVRIVRMIMSAHGCSHKSILTVNVTGFILFVLAYAMPFAFFTRQPHG
jgi:hypothetical protein